MAVFNHCPKIGTNENVYDLVNTEDLSYLNWLFSNEGTQKSVRPGLLLPPNRNDAFHECTVSEFSAIAEAGATGVLVRTIPVVPGEDPAMPTSHDTFTVWTDTEGNEFYVDLVMIPLAVGSYSRVEGRADNVDIAAGGAANHYWERRVMSFSDDGQRVSVRCANVAADVGNEVTLEYDLLGVISAGANCTYFSAHTDVNGRAQNSGDDGYSTPFVAVVDFVPHQIEDSANRWIEEREGGLTGIFRAAADLIFPQSKRKKNVLSEVAKLTSNSGIASITTTSVMHCGHTRNVVGASASATAASAQYSITAATDEQIRHDVPRLGFLAPPELAWHEPGYVHERNAVWLICHIPGLLTAQVPVVAQQNNYSSGSNYHLIMYRGDEHRVVDAVDTWRFGPFASRITKSTTSVFVPSDVPGYLYADAGYEATQEMVDAAEAADTQPAQEESVATTTRAPLETGASLIPREGKTNDFFCVRRHSGKDTLPVDGEVPSGQEGELEEVEGE